MRVPTLILVASLLATAALPLAFAGELAPGDRLPDLGISDKGELLLNEGDVSYRPWSYPQQPGRVHVVQYLAATRSAGDMNEALTDRMKAELPQNGEFLSSTILNLDEAMWGTSGLVISELKSNKQAFPHAVLVVDAKGKGLQQWQLEKESSAIIVTDPEGTVRYFKQGALSAAEIDSTLALIRGYLKPGNAAGP